MHAKKTSILGIIAIGLIFVVLAFVDFQKPFDGGNDVNVVQDNVVVAPPTISKNDPYLGPADAKVTMIGFIDFGCKSCASAFGMMQKLHARVPDAKFVWKDLPLHAEILPNVRLAHYTARCAQKSGKFWEYAQMVFQEGGGTYEIDFNQIAKDVGVNLEEFNSCMRSKFPVEVVEKNLEDAKERKILSTPYFYINDTVVGGLIPINQFQKILIDAK